MTSFDHLNATGSIHHLIRHFGNIETTIIAGERYISPEPTPDRRGLMAPGPAHRLQRRPGGLPGEQRLRHLRTGQAPDFVLEIASPSTGNRDVTEKRDGYAALGIPEYWRFDPKGKVEGMVGYMRRNFLAPVPSFESFEALNAHLERRCLARMDARLRGHSESIGQRMERDLEALLPLPEAPYDACEKQAGRVSSLSLVRYRTNDYSAPVAYGHRDVLVKGYVDRVVISCGVEVIARHHRSYQRDDFVFDPVHYLPLLEQKTGALDQAAPLQGWDLPEEFATLRRLLESRMGRRGKREFVQVLRLLENFSLEEVQSAVKDALRLGALSFDAVKHLVLCQLEGRPPRLDLELYPYLPRVSVNTTSAGDYMTLLSGRAA